MSNSGFRMGRLDHVHVRVPDRARAATWYAEHLGFEPVAEFEFWANGFDGGPLQISADGGHTMLALFEATPDHPMEPHPTGIAFSVDASMFLQFARSLPGEIPTPDRRPLQIDDVIDFDLCWAYEFTDPWGNRFELNTYDYDTVQAEFAACGVTPQRLWPADLYPAYRGR